MSKLFVRLSNLDQNDTEQDRIALITSVFAPAIALAETDVLIIPNREYGGLKNFCFVTVPDDKKDEVISALDGTTSADGYDIVVNEAQDQPPRNNNNRGGGYNRGGDRGGYSNNRY
jgi:hypothetical protein